MGWQNSWKSLQWKNAFQKKVIENLPVIDRTPFKHRHKKIIIDDIVRLQQVLRIHNETSAAQLLPC